MIYIDIENHPPPEAWLDRADELTLQLLAALNNEARERIIDGNQKLWGELKDHFSSIRNRKCWYSESQNDYSYCHVDHFRPKGRAIDENGDDQGGYWWLAFDWRNYRFSAPAGNIPKKDYFHVTSGKAMNPEDALESEDILFLDPTQIDDPGKLAYNNEGLVTPKSTDKTSREFKQAEYTIRRLKLNDNLIDARKDKFRKTTSLIDGVKRLLPAQARKFDVARRQAINAKLKELRDLAHPDSLYSATVKFCLKSSGEDWAIEIALLAYK